MITEQIVFRPTDADDQHDRNQAALTLLDEWEADTSGYEEANAGAIERALKSAENGCFSLREVSPK